MGWTFQPFRIWFEKNHPTRRKMDFLAETKLHPTVAAKIWSDRFHVSTETIERICVTYHLPVEQVIRYDFDADQLSRNDT